MMNTSRPVRLALIAPEPEGRDQLAQMYGAQLAKILSTDIRLAQELGHPLPERPIEGDQFIQETTEWCAGRNAVSYAIVLGDNSAVGQLSISRMDVAQGSARVGYLLASAHWGAGIMTQAFALALDEARSRGFQTVCGFIPTGHAASQRLWSRHGAVAEQREGSSFMR